MLTTPVPTAHPALMESTITLATARQDSLEHIAKRVGKVQRKEHATSQASPSDFEMCLYSILLGIDDCVNYTRALSFHER